MECTFCKKTFSTKSNLVAHVKTAKYCLEMQGKTEPIFECEFCKKALSQKATLLDHLSSCKERYHKLAENKEVEYKSIIKKLETEISKLKRSDKESLQKKDEYYQEKIKEKNNYYEEKIKEKNDYITKLEANIEKLEAKLEKFEDTVTSIVISKEKKQSMTTNNTTNNIVINALNLNDIPKISSFLEEKLDKDVLAGGQKGLAVLVSSTMLKDKYKCVDASRQNFEFINELGEVERDVKAKKLTNALIKSEICSKAGDKGIKLWTKEDGTTDSLRHDAFSANVLELINFDRDNSTFRSELTTLTS
jgi:Zinc finger, C2H2 type